MPERSADGFSFQNMLLTEAAILWGLRGKEGHDFEDGALAAIWISADYLIDCGAFGTVPSLAVSVNAVVMQSGVRSTAFVNVRNCAVRSGLLLLTTVNDRSVVRLKRLD